MTRSTALTGALLLGLAGTAAAHFPILTGDGPFAQKGKRVVLRYAFGHPFEAERIAAAKPTQVVARTPSGKTLDLTSSLVAAGTAKARSWTLPFVPAERGDHWIVVRSAPARHGQEELVDVTKLVLNVSSVQKGWDKALALPIEIVPLTRPYGLPLNVSLRAKVLVGGKPLAGAKVEVEAHNATRPTVLPPEAFITRVEKTNAAGGFAVTLDRKGWWILSVRGAGAQVKRGKQTVTRVTRGNLWVHVGR